MKIKKIRCSFQKSILIMVLFVLGTILASFSHKKSRDFDAVACEMQFSQSEELFYQVRNNDGLPLYYFKNIKQYPCDDKVCEQMELRMYWDLWGNFIKLAMGDGRQLTKIDHKPFTNKDYNQLHRLLIDPNCRLQYYKLDELVNHEAETGVRNIDGVTEATEVEPTFNSVKGAVRTCYTLWNICYGSIQQEIRVRTITDLANGDVQCGEFTASVHSDTVGFKLIEELCENTRVRDSLFYLMNVIERHRIVEKEDKSWLKSLAKDFQMKDSPGTLLIYNLLLKEKVFCRGVREVDIASFYGNKF